MTSKREYREKYQRLLDDSDSWVALAHLQFVEGLERCMHKGEVDEISQRELARLAKVHPPAVNRWLRGEVNPKLRSLVTLARGLRAVVHIHVAPENVPVSWTEGSPATPVRGLAPATGKSTLPHLAPPVEGGKDDSESSPEIPARFQGGESAYPPLWS